ncbi:peptidoglycan-binding protein [Candidatus Kaiserbacteria bacterium]|nr:MAG: peptidoglycan-binding protein [Candidatus Kaiserbacteria bacterium]
MLRKFIPSLMLIVALAVPATSYAMTQDELRTKIQELVRLVSSLQAQINATEREAVVVTDFTSCVSAGNPVMESYPRQCAHNGRTFVEVIVEEPITPVLICPSFSHNMRLGSSGTNVATLQRFLQSAGVYTYPVITGYYGSITQAAVQRFQEEHGVVSFGSPATTGYGSVGPATRAAITRLCSGTPLPEPVACTMEYAPVCGKYPGMCIDTIDGSGGCYEGATKTFGNSCQLKAASAEFLYTGECRVDTKKPENPRSAPNNCRVWNDGCNTCTRAYEGGPLACTKRMCFWEGVAKCESYFDSIGPSVSFSASPTSGNAPLRVSFSAPGGYSCADGPDYEIDYGDGTRESTPICSSGQHTLTHTYTQTGTYTATLYSIPSGFGTGDRTPRVAGTKTIIVNY